MRPRVTRGSMLLAALLVSGVLLLMGLALLSVRSREHSESRIARDALQARLAARAGVVTAMAKLSKDVRFPPHNAGQKVFAFAELLYDPQPSTGGPPVAVASYAVRVDLTHRYAADGADLTQQSAYDYPAFTVQIRSTGRSLGTDGDVRATREVVSEVDLSPKQRKQPVVGVLRPEQATDASPYYTNPNYFKPIRWEDQGAF